MREVALTWEEAALEQTDLAELLSVVKNFNIAANLLITNEGVRQVILPTYREGKSAEDLDNISYLTVEQSFSDREEGALVVWNTHALGLFGIIDR